MNLTELCKFIQQSGFEIAILADPMTGGVKFIIRKWYGEKHKELLMDVNFVTPEQMGHIEEQMQMLINRAGDHYEQLTSHNNTN